MALTGHNPVEGYKYLIQGGLKNPERIGNTLATATPLILTGLSVAFAFRTGLFNIGAAGQMLFGGFCATAVGLSLDRRGRFSCWSWCWSGLLAVRYGRLSQGS